jgi:serine/threonine-protein kinase
VSEHVERLKTALAGRYASSREIGRGGIATVYLAPDLRHERESRLPVGEAGRTSRAVEERFALLLSTNLDGLGEDLC